MTEDQYRKLFETLGIEARGLGRVLRYGGLPRRVYFNPNEDVGIYFSARRADEAWYPGNLWEKIDSYRVQKVDHGRLNVVPRSGMEKRAFENLVSNWRSIPPWAGEPGWPRRDARSEGSIPAWAGEPGRLS